MAKRVLSLLLTLVMVLSLCVPALAAEEFEAEAPAEVVEEAPVAPEAPVEPEAEEPAEEPAEAPAAEEPEIAAVLEDEPETIDANVDAETVAALDEMIKEAEKILPLIGTTYCIQVLKDEKNSNGDLVDDGDGYWDSVILDDEGEEVTDHGKAKFEAALDTLKLYRAEITDEDQWYGGLSTQKVKDAMDAMQKLMDAKSEEAADTEILAIGAKAIFHYNGYSDTFIEQFKDNTADDWEKLDQQSVDELLDALKQDSYTGYASEYKDGGWYVAGADVTLTAQVLKLQPSYLDDMVNAIEAARAALADGADHAAVVEARNALKVLDPDYENEDEGIYNTTTDEHTANNRWIVAHDATGADLKNLSDTAEAEYKALADEGVCAPDSFGPDTTLEIGNLQNNKDKDGDTIIVYVENDPDKGIVTHDTIENLFEAVDKGCLGDGNINAALKLAVQLSESVTASAKKEPLEAVNKLLYIFKKLAPKTIPEYAELYGVTPYSHVKDTLNANQQHSTEVTFKGFDVNVQALTKAAGALDDTHTYYLKWSLGTTDKGIMKDKEVDGAPYYLRWGSDGMYLVTDVAGGGTLDSTALAAPLKYTAAKEIKAGQKITVTLMAGVWDETGAKNGDGAQVKGAHAVGDPITLVLDPLYIGPETRDNVYYGYTGGSTVGGALGQILGTYAGSDSMYVAFDRKFINVQDRYNDATVYFVGPDASAGSFHLDVNGYFAAIKFTGNGATNTTSDGSTVSNVKLVPGDWTATVKIDQNDNFDGNKDIFEQDDYATQISVAPEDAEVSFEVKIHVKSLKETEDWAKLKAAIASLGNYMSWTLKDYKDDFAGVESAVGAYRVGRTESVDRKLLAQYRQEAKVLLEDAQRVESNCADLVDIAQNRATVDAILSRYDALTAKVNTKDDGDYSALEALIEKAKNFTYVDYTATSWYDWSHPIANATYRAVQSPEGEWTSFDYDTGKKTALDWAENFAENHLYGAERQFYIDEAVRVFQMFIDKLVPVPADKTDLDAAIKEAEAAFDATKEYTEDSLKAYEDALAEAKVVLNDPTATQTEVDEAEKALEDAVAGLEEVVPVDKTALDEAIAAADELKAEDYTEETWGPFEKALKEAKAASAKEDATQAEVDAAEKALKDAQDALESVVEPPEVDKSELEAAIAEAEALTAEDYTEESFAEVTEALEAAKTVAADEAATQEAVDAAADALNAAIEALEAAPVDKTELEVAIALAEALADYEDDYTAESWAAMLEVLEDAQAVYDDAEATQAEVDAAVDALADALNALEEIPADKTELNEDIAWFEENLDEIDYTAESWAAFQEVLADAKAVAADEDATQSEVDAADEALVDAYWDVLEYYIPAAPSSGTGWVQAPNGDIYFYQKGQLKTNFWVGKADGASQWDGNWYFVDETGRLATGLWYLYDMHGGMGYYYLQPTNKNGEIGKMLTGWQYVDEIFGTGWFSNKNGSLGKCTYSTKLGNWNGETFSW